MGPKASQIIAIVASEVVKTIVIARFIVTCFREIPEARGWYNKRPKSLTNATSANPKRPKIIEFRLDIAKKYDKYYSVVKSRT